MLSSGITWQIIMLDFQSFTLIWLYKFFQHIWQKLEIIYVVIFQTNYFLQFLALFDSNYLSCWPIEWVVAKKGSVGEIVG